MVMYFARFVTEPPFTNIIWVDSDRRSKIISLGLVLNHDSVEKIGKTTFDKAKCLVFIIFCYLLLLLRLKYGEW